MPDSSVGDFSSAEASTYSPLQGFYARIICQVDAILYFHLSFFTSLRITLPNTSRGRHCSAWDPRVRVSSDHKCHRPGNVKGGKQKGTRNSAHCRGKIRNVKLAYQAFRGDLPSEAIVPRPFTFVMHILHYVRLTRWLALTTMDVPPYGVPYALYVIAFLRLLHQGSPSSIAFYAKAKKNVWIQAVGLCAAAIIFLVVVLIRHLTLAGRSTPVILYNMQVWRATSTVGSVFFFAVGVVGSGVERACGENIKICAGQSPVCVCAVLPCLIESAQIISNVGSTEVPGNVENLAFSAFVYPAVWVWDAC